MTDKEVQEITKILEDAGWEPQLCDTPIPVYESVHAGNPEDPGQIPPEMALVPRAFLNMFREAMVKVKGDFEAFCNLVKSVVPDHEHLPSVQEMQRMAVLSFNRQVRYWNVSDAPVKGWRFKAYMNIAERVFELLED